MNDEDRRAARDIRSGSLDSSLRVLRERKWVIIAIVVIVVGAVLGASLKMTPEYEATAQVLRQTAALDRTLFGTSVFDSQDAQLQLQTGANLVKLNAVAEMVKKDLGSPLTTQSLRAMVTVATVNQYDVIRITAQSPDPNQAAAVANSFARQFIIYRRQADQAVLVAAQAQVQDELDKMSSAGLASNRGKVLIQKLEELGVLASMQTGGFALVQPAAVPASPSSPKPLKNTAFALLGALVAGALLAFGLDRVDRRLNSEEALERQFELPVLASTPRLGRRWIKQGSKHSCEAVGFSEPSPQFAESFRTLRSNLKYFEFDRQIRTILITSGLPQEGKTITTVNLATSLALSGARVIVIEADLRRPMLHKYLNLADTVGVSTLLAGTHPLEGALQSVSSVDRTVAAHRTDGAATVPRLERNFYCLSSGPIPPNPAELVGSRQMAKLIADAAAAADYVLVDTPPLLVVSDAVSLFSAVDAVVICARINSTTVEQAREVRTILQRTGAHALGLVAGGVKSPRHRQYGGYGYYVDHVRGETGTKAPSAVAVVRSDG